MYGHGGLVQADVHDIFLRKTIYKWEQVESKTRDECAVEDLLLILCIHTGLVFHLSFKTIQQTNVIGA